MSTPQTMSPSCSDWMPSSFPMCCAYCSTHSEPSNELQLVILGPGYTGKTTLRHHLVQRYGHAFCKADFLMYRDILQHNVLDLLRDLLQRPSLTLSTLKQLVQPSELENGHSDELDDSPTPSSPKSPLELATDNPRASYRWLRRMITNSTSRNTVELATPTTPNSPSTLSRSTNDDIADDDKLDASELDAASLLSILANEELKYGRDNGRYLIENLSRILSDHFEPTFIDLLQCHVRSTGLMFEKHIAVPSPPSPEMVFRVVDVGGHRNERKKWSFVLGQENDAIIFVVSAASFCQVLFEDFKKNALRESVAVWREIVSGLDAQSSSAELVLVINKMDLFDARWPSFAQYFAEYAGPHSATAVLQYIKGLFLAHTRGKRTVHTVCTQLTDIAAITRCDADVRAIREILQGAHCGLYRDIAETVMRYAMGDVFWSDSLRRALSAKSARKEDPRDRRRQRDFGGAASPQPQRQQRRVNGADRISTGASVSTALSAMWQQWVGRGNETALAEYVSDRYRANTDRE